MAGKVKITARVDMAGLLKSLRKEAKRFGESTRDATARMGLQAARELAGNTQVFGRDWKTTLAKQKQAIVSDMLKVFLPIPASVVMRNPRTLEQAMIISNNHRVRGHARVREETPRIRITRDVAWALLESKFKHANMAKAAWIGSARHLERQQGSGMKIVFGKAFGPHLRKWESLGHGTNPTAGFKPSVTMSNTVRHTAMKYVLSEAKKRNAQKWAVSKTLKWYEKAATANLAKNKP